MKIVSSAVMRELDRRAIEEFGIKSRDLMDRAGHGVATSVRRLAETFGYANPYIHVIAGRGNNGGDGFAAARYLKDMGFAVEVWLAGTIPQVSGDAAYFLSRCKQAKIPVEELPTLEDWQEAIANPLIAEIVVDGVLGVGIKGPPRGPVAGAIQYIRAQADEAVIVSIDVPSGLNADSGLPEGDAVKADLTVTMGLPKRGLVNPAAIDYVGTIEVVDIGLPSELVNEAEADDLAMIYVSDLYQFYPRRFRNSHKHQYGHALLIGGGAQYTGAMTLAARAAVRSGVGLVTVVVPEALRQTVATAVPEAMVLGAPQETGGTFSEAAWSLIRDLMAGKQAVMAGPGMTRSAVTRRFVENLLAECQCALVLDADALTVFAGDLACFRGAADRLVITPHPGEAAVLLGLNSAQVQADRIAAARMLVEQTGAIVVLKGAGTIVAGPGFSPHVNMTGNPGMAKGGSGDVLSGLMAGILAQGFSAFTAACAAVYVHGRAGDLGAWRKCQVSLTPSDIVDELPFAFRDLSLR